MNVKCEKFGVYGGKDVFAYTLKNKSGAFVKILTYGGIINKIVVPDKNGKLGDVVCGFDKVEDYVADKASYTGSLVGRCGNRISKSGFSIGDNLYTVFNNERGLAHLHGGNVGFSYRLWDAEVKKDRYSASLVFSLFSPDGDEGYPGNLFVTVTYTFDDDNALTIDYKATTDKDTYINMTNHAYYNLNGYDGGSVMGHVLKMPCDYYDAVDELLLPTAKTPVDGTAFDFRNGKEIGVGFDHNFHINGEAGDMRVCAEVYAKESGRTLKMYTDAPAVQLYTAVGMDGETNFKGGVKQQKLCAFCLETQNPPDLPNRPELTQRFTKAGETYHTTTKVAFGVAKN